MENKKAPLEVVGITLTYPAVMGMVGGLEGLAGIFIALISKSLTLTKFDGTMIAVYSVGRSLITMIGVANLLRFETPKWVYNFYLVAALLSVF